MRRSLIVVCAVLLLLGAACSGGGDDDAASADVDERVGEVNEDAAGGATEAGGAPGAGGGGGDGSIAGVPVGMPLTGGRSIISTATVAVTVDDVERAARRATALATAAGGFLAAQDAQLADREIDLVLRVPSARFHETLDGVAALGEVVEAAVRTDDVTEQVVDLEGRTSSARASIERLRTLLDRAGDVAQLATVEGELARREAELESLLGRLRVLEDQVDLSTIDVALSEEPAPAPDDDDDLPGFLDALGNGWSALATAGRVVAAGTGFVLPFAAIALALAGAAVLVRRRGVPGRNRAV